ncbi:Ubiquitin-conjugating enzyme E2C-binding protein [Metarhizium album ARSEF 1941]|uniref:Ubiquitin-conjugating enzyme E2C-binding protein n=1 Tax=Metarhizium album (strain ARSEF 1941) TaxID=1081103 RepID=A0A0B2WV00_METAS|nr:Ubiquitin-conjugating enzyme E2C-binding protein [Metarhizium album ARSEF 1941]KHN99926.1 Ubiquitin-conjugating enzyme E2C-binding protein [Metarhizium album ARSEF 1941]
MNSSICPGKKKVARSAFDGYPMIWSSIQFPNIIDSCWPLPGATTPPLRNLLTRGWVLMKWVNSKPLSFSLVLGATVAGRPHRGTFVHKRFALFAIYLGSKRHLNLMLTSCQFSTSTPAKAVGNSADAVAGATPPKFLHIFCSECTAENGLYNIRVGSVTLFKWQVRCSTTVPTSRVPSGPECLAASLVANISRSGSAKSLISAHAFEKGQISTTPLYLWVLNPNVIYSSSSIQGKRTAMKVLYQHVTAEEGDKLIDSIVSDVQDLNLPTTTIQSSSEILKSSNCLLPEKERSFKEWQVGLLDRWDAML